MFDFPNQDIVSDSYLFVRGANRYAYQRTRALAAVNQENPVRQRRKNQLSVIIKSVRVIHWDVSLVCITYPSTACVRLMV